MDEKTLAKVTAALKRDSDLAELQRLAAKYGFKVVPNV